VKCCGLKIVEMSVLKGGDWNLGIIGYPSPTSSSMVCSAEYLSAQYIPDVHQYCLLLNFSFSGSNST